MEVDFVNDIAVVDKRPTSISGDGTSERSDLTPRSHVLMLDGMRKPAPHLERDGMAASSSRVRRKAGFLISRELF